MTTLDKKNVSLLLVEDDSKYLEELIAWLNKFGYQQIETARDAAQAKVKLEQPFDLIVADMRWHDEVRIEMIEQQYVCAVDVEKALGPVFMNGLRGIEFYIRSGQETIQISEPEKIANYIREHCVGN